MGSGKTYFGKKWAEASGMTFYDLDDLIEQETGESIKEIFETKGEAFFRKAESEMLRNLKNTENAMIACGGGTPCFNENMPWMNEHGHTIYLDATAEYLLKNLEHESQTRPLLKGISEENKLEKIQALLAKRIQHYEQANHIIDMNADPNAQFKMIIDLYA